MAVELRINPDFTNELGVENKDSITLPEFTFHHGHVERVINTSDDISNFKQPLSNLPSDVSQMILITSTFKGDLGSKDYKPVIPCQPLLRGFSDSITRGDSVIYTNIGGINYYLGPLNTTNNPNITSDSFYESEINPFGIELDMRKDNSDGTNVNYIKAVVDKIKKVKNIFLDRPFDVGIGELGSDAEVESSYSDLQLEGRYGNSIQLGARFINPYTIIQNNHTPYNNGSYLGMLSLGSIPNYVNQFDGLSSDKVVLKSYEEGQDQYKGYLIGIGNPSISQEGIPPQNEFNINYGSVKPTPEQQTEFDQIIMFSDRITFDAQENDLTISAFRNINVGAGQNISITSKGFSLIESNNIYLGVQSQKKKEPMVLGDELRKMLEDITKILKNAHALVQGVPVPLTDALGAPLGTSKSVALESPILTLTEIVTQLESRTETEDDNGNINYSKDGPKFLSHHHYIEQNNRSNNEG